MKRIEQRLHSGPLRQLSVGQACRLSSSAYTDTYTVCFIPKGQENDSVKVLSKVRRCSKVSKKRILKCTEMYNLQSHWTYSQQFIHFLSQEEKGKAAVQGEVTTHTSSFFSCIWSHPWCIEEAVLLSFILYAYHTGVCICMNLTCRKLHFLFMMHKGQKCVYLCNFYFEKGWIQIELKNTKCCPMKAFCFTEAS